MIEIIDISPPLSPDMPVWPGDQPLSRRLTASMAAGDAFTASRMECTVHLGAHADAPSHVVAGGRGIDEIPLETYVGPCEVVSTPFIPGGVVPPEVAGGLVDGVERVLIRTTHGPAKGSFRRDFMGLSIDLVAELVRRRVRLVAVDSPSVDRFVDEDLPAHRACAAGDLAIVEGLVLADVSPGAYELIALPLALMGFDGSPLRAILRRETT